MKYLILGDLHCRSIWKDIVAKEEDSCDKIIFLGEKIFIKFLDSLQKYIIFTLVIIFKKFIKYAKKSNYTRLYRKSTLGAWRQI